MPSLPRKCPKCEEPKVVQIHENYRATLEHDGRSYDIEVPQLQLLQCEGCGNRVLDDATDDKLTEALRHQIGLLSPAEIRRGRVELGLNQKELAEHLDVAEATLGRWETGGQLQQRAMDKLLRLYFASEEVRRLLQKRFPPPFINGMSPQFDGWADAEIGAALEK